MSMQLVRVLSVLLLVRLATSQSVAVVSPGHDCALKVKFVSLLGGRQRFGELAALAVTS